MVPAIGPDSRYQVTILFFIKSLWSTCKLTTWIGLAQLGDMDWAGTVGVLGHIWLFVLIRDEHINKRSYNSSHNSIFSASCLVYAASLNMFSFLVVKA